MAVHQTSSHAPFGAETLYRVISSVEVVVVQFNKWNIERRTRKSLESLSDHQLYDIGLGRGDIDAVATGIKTRL